MKSPCSTLADGRRGEIKWEENEINRWLHKRWLRYVLSYVLSRGYMTWFLDVGPRRIATGIFFVDVRFFQQGRVLVYDERETTNERPERKKKKDGNLNGER